MNTTDFNASRFSTVQSGATPTLHYRCAQLLKSGNFLFEATLKVHRGVRHTVCRWPTPPTVEEMIRECARHGEFGERPYLLGQDRDACASTCVFALLQDFCQKSGIDCTDLVLRGDPGAHSGEGWVLGWPQIRAEAQWQGILYPRHWTTDRVVALMHSLYNIDRRPLVDVLLDTIAQRSNPRIPRFF